MLSDSLWWKVKQTTVGEQLIWARPRFKRAGMYVFILGTHTGTTFSYRAKQIHLYHSKPQSSRKYQPCRPPCPAVTRDLHWPIIANHLTGDEKQQSQKQRTTAHAGASCSFTTNNRSPTILQNDSVTLALAVRVFFFYFRDISWNLLSMEANGRSVGWRRVLWHVRTMFKNVFGSGFLVRTAHVILTWVITLILFLHDTGKLAMLC